MPVPAIIPKLGNTVESCIIVEWKKAVGDVIAEGETLLDVETDKAVMEVPSPASGTVLAHFYAAGDLVPVLDTIAVIGESGEDWSAFGPDGEDKVTGRQGDKVTDALEIAEVAAAVRPSATSELTPVSPRARSLAQRERLDVTGLAGSGPGGRIIERDVQAALASRPKLSPVAQAKLAEGGLVAPEKGSGPGGRVMMRDLRVVEEGRQVDKAEVDKVEVDKEASERKETRDEPEVEVVKVTGVRKVIAERMLASLQTTAQLTLNASADARGLQALRARFKGSDPAFGLQGVTINDLILQARRVTPDELRGGTFTVTNLGGLGIESFTPVLNPPEVAILGVSNINLKAVQHGDASAALSMTGTAADVAFVPHIGLSLTINHQVVDGAPAARFLQALARNLADIDLLLAG